ncbi:hypothetical protein [Bacillus pumilus]|uniref:hypothetical protein n=1 Tax=Bacillus pumilus TaxID=1408 RepID=UPI00119F6B6B|nr:hypothetical protein [Bacillus pumilus]
MYGCHEILGRSHQEVVVLGLISVFIGVDLGKGDMIRRLDEWLVTREEFDEDWSRFEEGFEWKIED